ncbi:hypothetical protein YC2023_100356 [Brassica napus]
MVVIVVITSSASELKEWKRHMVHSRLDAPDDLHLPLLPLQRVIIWLSNEEEFWSAFEDESAIWFATGKHTLFYYHSYVHHQL